MLIKGCLNNRRWIATKSDILLVADNRTYLSRCEVGCVNSLYWDFCSASYRLPTLQKGGDCKLSIPFIGIFALHLIIHLQVLFVGFLLSIPFIGIFALHRVPYHFIPPLCPFVFQFPLLGFLLCIRKVVLQSPLLESR